MWDDYGIWKGSVFGDVGGTPTTANFALGKTENGNMNIAVSNGKGKISSTADGIAMYYYKVPASSTFTLTATAKVNSFVKNDQVAFGLMARDAMYIDTNTKDSLGDYVAAGTIKLGNPSNAWNCFARKAGALTKGGSVTNELVAGDTVELKIESNSDGYACTYGEEQTVTGGFDFRLTSIDSEYVYVGMFVSRNANVEFSNIKLIVDGVDVSETGIVPTPTPAPSTGDANNIYMYVVCLMSAIIGLAAIVAYEKKGSRR